jgi:ribosomal protein S18 acetylase RimI-like enzyme
MSAGVVLRPARPDDAATIACVQVETWRNAYPGMVPEAYLVAMSEARHALHWDQLLRANPRPETVLVAEAAAEGSGVIGFGSCGRARGGPCLGEVYTLYVAGDWQGRGVGRRLLGGLFAALREGEVDDAVIWVLSNNPARYFYEAMGGRRMAERKESFAGTLLDETAYGWLDLEAWLGAHSS